MFKVESTIAPYLPASQGQHRLLLLQGVLLSTLAIQNCAMGFLLSYQRPQSSLYNPASAVAVAEFLKFFLSAIFVVIVTRRKEEYAFLINESDIDPRQLSRMAYLKSRLLNRGTLFVAGVAILFVIQGNLKVLSAPLVTPTRFQILQEAKLVFVVAASIAILKTKVAPMQWLAVVLTMGSVVLLQLQPSQSAALPSQPDTRTPAHQRLGSLGMLIVGMLGALAGVLIEKAMRTTDMWIINAQLSMCSLIPAFFPLLFTPRNIFAGYDVIAWVTVLNMAFGGLLVGLVVKYCSNIAKTFTTPFAILLSYFISTVFLGMPWSWSTVIAGLVVTSACIVYNRFKVVASSAVTEPGDASTLSEASEDLELAIGEMNGKAPFTVGDEEEPEETPLLVAVEDMQTHEKPRQSVSADL